MWLGLYSVICCGTDRETYILQTYRQTDKQTYKQIEEDTHIEYRLTGRQTERLADKHRITDADRNTNKEEDRHGIYLYNLYSWTV